MVTFSGVIFTLLLILFLRSPQRLTEAQFWAEDANIFFRSAFELDFLSSVFKPHEGYLQLIPRVISELALVGGNYQFTPFVMNFVSMLVAAVILAIFSTKLYHPLIASSWLRYLLPLVIAAGGAHHEIIGNVTNLQWYIVIVGLHLCALVYYYPGLQLKWPLALLSALLICIFVISSPQILIFFPILLLLLIKKKLSHSNYLLIFGFVLGVVIQVLVYLSFRGPAQATIQDLLSKQYLLGLVQVSFIKFFVQSFIPYPAADYFYKNNLAGLLTGSFAIVATFYLLMLRKRRELLVILGWVVLFSTILLYIGRSGVFAPTLSSASQDISYIHVGRYFFVGYVVIILSSFYVVSSILEQKRLQKHYLAIILFIHIIALASFFNTKLIYVNYNWTETAARLRTMQTGGMLTFSSDPVGWQTTVVKP